MRAQEFFEKVSSKIKAPTDRKKINAARKHGLRDKYSAILWFTGLPREKAQEFIDREG